MDASKKDMRFRVQPKGTLFLVVLFLISAVVAARLTTKSVTPVVSPTPGKVTRRVPVEEPTKIFEVESSWARIDNPATDGWETEAFNEKANKQLKLLGQLLVSSESIVSEHLDDLVTSDCSCEPLLPRQLEEVFRDQVFRIERGITDRDSTQSPKQVFRDRSGVAKALRELVEPFEGAEDLRFKFKLFGVNSATKSVTTRQFLALSGRTDNGMLEQNATWTIRWSMSNRKLLPKITWIGVEKFEQVRAHQEEPLLADCTQSVLGRNSCYENQFLLGFNYWLERIQDLRYTMIVSTPGLAVGDVNGDGLDDLYVCQETGLPNRLFLHKTDGTAVDASERWGVDWLESSRSALIIDLDNDGDQDLVVATMGGLVVASNEDQQRFQIRVVVPTSDDTHSLSAVDYDLDGDLDLFVCVYNQDVGTGESDSRSILSGLVGSNDLVYYDETRGGINSLLRNDIVTSSDSHPWEFTDVTDQAGIDVNNNRFSLASAWEDFDNDGDQDLYVANDFGPNCLYRNDHGRFEEIATSAGVEDRASGMSVAWGDYDRNGHMDLYVANMFSAAGHRITLQSSFKSNASDDERRMFQRFAKGNTLLKNLGNGQFEDFSAPAAVTMGRWGWSSLFIDLNNDGWEDLLSTNGYITASDTGDL